MDAQGNLTRNSQDTVSVLIRTQETLWNVPEEIDYTSNKAQDPFPYLIQGEIYDADMVGVEFQILEVDSGITVQDVISGMKYRFQPNRARNITIQYGSPTTNYPHYNMDSSTLEALMNTFVGITLDLKSYSVDIPLKQMETTCDLEFISCNVNVPANPLLIVNSFTATSCNFVSSTERSTFIISVVTGFKVRQITTYDNVSFQVQSKSSSPKEWTACEAVAINCQILSSTNDKFTAGTFSFTNFNVAKVVYLQCKIQNPNGSALGFFNCQTVKVNNFTQDTNYQRNVVLIRSEDTINFSVDSLTDQSFGSYTIGYSSEKISTISITDTVVQNGGLIKLIGENIKKLTISGVTMASVANMPIASTLLGVTSVLLRNTTIDATFLDSKTITNFRIDNCELVGDSLNLNGISSLIIENDSKIQIGILNINLAANGSMSVDHSVFSSNLTVTGDTGSDGKTFTSAFGATNFSQFTGDVHLQDLLKASLQVVKIVSNTFSAKAKTIGTSSVDIHTDSVNHFTLDSDTLTSFSASIFRVSGMYFNFNLIGFNNGTLLLRLRDSDKDGGLRNINLNTKNSLVATGIMNEEIANSGTITLISADSVGSSIQMADSTVTAQTTYLMDNTCADFPNFKKAINNPAPLSSYIYG